MLLKGTLSGRDVNELIEQCHPMVRKKFFFAGGYSGRCTCSCGLSVGLCFCVGVRQTDVSWLSSLVVLCVPRLDLTPLRAKREKIGAYRPTMGGRHWENVSKVVARAESSRLV